MIFFYPTKVIELTGKENQPGLSHFKNTVMDRLNVQTISTGGVRDEGLI